MPDQLAALWKFFCAAPSEPHFELFFRETSGVVYTLCRRILHNAEDAEEAFQGAYARMFVEVSAEHPDPATALARLAVREATNLRKRRARRARKEVAVDSLPDREQETNVADALTQEQLRETLEQLVEEVPDDERLAIQLHYFH